MSNDVQNDNTIMNSRLKIQEKALNGAIRPVAERNYQIHH